MRDPNEDMRPHGFRKELVYKYIKVNEDKSLTCTEVAFYVADVPCGNSKCKTAEYTWLKAERTGVVRTCLNCSTTSGPMSQADGHIVKRYKISPDEALKILRARNAPNWQIKNVIKARTARNVISRKRPVPKESF